MYFGIIFIFLKDIVFECVPFQQNRNDVVVKWVDIEDIILLIRSLLNLFSKLVSNFLTHLPMLQWDVCRMNMRTAGILQMPASDITYSFFFWRILSYT